MTDRGGGVLTCQRAVVAEAAADPLGERRRLAFHLFRLYLNRLTGGDKRPLIGAEQTRISRLARLPLPLDRLVALARGEIELIAFGEYVAPGEIFAHRSL